MEDVNLITLLRSYERTRRYCIRQLSVTQVNGVSLQLLNTSTNIALRLNIEIFEVFLDRRALPHYPVVLHNY
jgi:hypothetical protein